MENKTEATENKQTIIYDATANQRYEFEIEQDGEKFDTAHEFKPLTDERYLAFAQSVKISGNEAAILEQTKQAAEELWDDLIIEVENFKPKEGQTLQESIERVEKVEAINNLLAVVIVPVDKNVKRERTPSDKNEQKITTEMFFNGVPVSQTHVVRKADEWRVKFDRIQRKRFKQEETKGLRREPKIEYVPQDEAIAALYDEMLIESGGFENNVIPLRVKTTVIYGIFASKVSYEKK